MSVDVTVIIACFNDGATIEDAVASATREGAATVIVVDDGSDDAFTKRRLAALQSKGCRVIAQSNMGLSAARMTALRAARTEWVLVLDADDEITPGALERLADNTLNEDAAVVFGDVEYFGELSGTVSYPWAWDPWLLTYMNGVTGGAVLVRRRAVLEIGGWVLKGGYEDWDVWMGLVERGYTGIHVPGLALRYRQRRGRMLSGSKKSHRKLYAQLRERHPLLFDRRPQNWRTSRAPLRLKLLAPIFGMLPLLPLSAQHRLTLMVASPTRSVDVRLQRLRRQLRSNR